MSAEYYTMGEDGFPHIDKDPNAQKGFTFDWTKWLTDQGASSISNASGTGEAGITVVSTTVMPGGKKVVIILSGGTAGVSYKVVCRITANDGQIDDRTIVVEVKET